MNVFVFFQILKHGALISENEGRVRNRGQISTNQAEGTVSAESPVGAESIEVQLPFDMEAFIQQQNVENKKLLEQMLAAQRMERESLYKSIEDGRKLLDESFEAQKEERKTFAQNIEENRKLLNRSFESQSAERNNS